MARTVEDAVRVFEAMAGPADPADPLSQLLQNVRRRFCPAQWTRESGQRIAHHAGNCALAFARSSVRCLTGLMAWLQVSLPANYNQFLNAGALKGVRIGVFRQIR